MIQGMLIYKDKMLYRVIEDLIGERGAYAYK